MWVKLVQMVLVASRVAAPSPAAATAAVGCEAAAQAQDLEQAVLDHYGRHLHVAARNRKAELDYIGHLIDSLFPHCLHVKTLKCRCTLNQDYFVPIYTVTCIIFLCIDCTCTCSLCW